MFTQVKTLILISLATVLNGCVGANIGKDAQSVLFFIHIESHFPKLGITCLVDCTAFPFGVSKYHFK